MKKIIIIGAGGNELANQLWNYASIYSYSLECGYQIKNPSFFEYGSYFSTPAAPNFVFKLFFFFPFRNYTKRKTAFRRKIWRKLYFWYARTTLRFYGNHLVAYKDTANKPYYLPPTKESEGKLNELEKGGKNICFDSWLFRNPAGLKKYRKEIREYFRPRDDIGSLVASQIKDLRTRYQNVVGVHIRQGDYETWRGGIYLIEQKRAREIIEEYLAVFGKNKEKTCFVITSDGPIKAEKFSGLNVIVSKNNAVADLFLLASTDAIIGSNSTFGAFASYYGNIPFIVMQKEKMDWKYYKNKNKFFENKFSTFVNY